MASRSVDPVILAVFGTPPDGLDLTENSAAKDKEAVIIMFVLSVIAIALRFSARALQRIRPHWDDWVIVLALCFVGGTSGMGIAGSSNGAGRHIWALQVTNVTTVYKILYAYLFLYASSCCTTKVSILLFYQRIFATQNRVFRAAVAVGYFLSLSYPVVIMVTMGTACQPVSHFWMQFAGAVGHCINVNRFFYAMGIINMITDFYALVIPIPQIVSLQMSWQRKLGITGIMMLGGFAVRIYYLTKLVATIDVTSAMGPLFIWSDVEPSIAIASACLPHLAPLRRVVSKTLASRYGTGGGSSSGRNHGSGPRPGHGGSSAGATSGPLYTFGGSRYFGGDKAVKLVDAEDEIQLTNRVTASSVLGKTASSRDSASLENLGSGSTGGSGGIAVRSSFVQTSTPRA